ncbi:MAG: hypothetical protein ACPG6B_06110, partial [Oceanihabitans sp.]
TTSDKLMMTGEPVNISNIERKIKDGISTVTDTVSDVAKNVSDTVSDAAKNVDFKKKSNSLKSTSKSFFETIGDILFFLKIAAKFIGVILIIIGASALIGLIIGMFSVGLSDVLQVPGFDIIDAANAANTPVWLVSLLALFAIGVPFFFIFYLGLKILINNLKSIGNIAKFSLLGLWLMAIVGLIYVGISQAREHAFDASVNKKEILNITANDTLTVKMAFNESYLKRNSNYRNRGTYNLFYNENDEKEIYSSNIRLIVRSTKDSLASLQIEKNAEGKSFVEAKKRANAINYNYVLANKQLDLDAFLTTNAANKFRDQEVELILYLPEGSVLIADENTYYFHSNASYYNDILDNGTEGHYLKIKNGFTKCLDCEENNEENEAYHININVNEDDASLKINEKGLEIKTEESHLIIDENGVNGNSEEIKVNIDENGIKISTDD